MNVSLTERCYELLAREAPVASDLRFVVSVLRVLGELERIGDLALRVVKLAPDWELLRSGERTFDILLSMADMAVGQYRTALRAWAAQDLQLADELARSVRSMDPTTDQLMRELLRLEGPDAVRVRGPYAYGWAGARPHRRPRVDHRCPPPVPAHRRPRPPRHRDPMTTRPTDRTWTGDRHG